MKTLIDNGNGTASFSESDGPPLEHEEWIEATAESHAEEEKSRAKSRRAAPRATERGGDDLESLTVPELRERAKDAGVEHFSTLNKSELIDALQK